MKDGDSRLHHGMDSAVIAKRSQHDMVVIENIRMGTRQIAARVVVAPDRRVIEDLEEDGLWGAYKDITRALNGLARGLGVQSSDLSRTRGTGIMDDETALLIAKYTKWYEECNRKYLAPLLVKKMIVDGLSLNAMDKEFKFYKGSTKLKVWKCLEVWDKV